MAVTQKKEEQRVSQIKEFPHSTFNPTTYAQPLQQADPATQQSLLQMLKNGTNQQNNTQQKQQATHYSGLQGVSDVTAQQLGSLQHGYNPSAAVQQAQQTLQGVLNQKPQGYESKYDAALNDIIQRIQNPEQFKYSFEGDALFKTLSDRYVQQGKQASMDAMGQAAALNGGYGSSYGQMVGQQTYDQYLQGLYDKGVDLYDRAWERYKYGQDQLMDQFSVLSQADQTDYGRYRDTVGDWENERQYATGRYDTENDRDYNKYMNELNYWTQMAGAENADYNTKQQMAEQKRQWDEQFNYNKMSDEKKYAYNICTSILANGKMPSKAQLKAAGISEADAKKMMAQAKTGGGGGGKSGGAKYYYKINGKYYDAETFQEVPEKQIRDTDYVKDGNEQLVNGVINAVKKVPDIVTNNPVTQKITGAVNDITQGASKMADEIMDMMGLKKKK